MDSVGVDTADIVVSAAASVAAGPGAVATGDVAVVGKGMLLALAHHSLSAHFCVHDTMHYLEA